MENQHKHIKGYRDLSEDEIALMNEVKAHAEQTKALLNRLHELRISMPVKLRGSAEDVQRDEALRCLALAKTNLQTGFMWFVRAVALPESF